MSRDGYAVLIAVGAALVGGTVWGVWRHNVVDELRAIRRLLERRLPARGNGQDHDDGGEDGDGEG